MISIVKLVNTALATHAAQQIFRIYNEKLCPICPIFPHFSNPQSCTEEAWLSSLKMYVDSNIRCLSELIKIKF